MPHTNAISDLATGTYTVITASGTGTYSNGVFVPPGTSSSTISAVVVPVSGKDREILPEGYRTDAFKTVYTTSTLVINEEDTSLSDKIIIAGENYQVIHLEYWDALDEEFYTVIVQREDE